MRTWIVVAALVLAPLAGCLAGKTEAPVQPGALANDSRASSATPSPGAQPGANGTLPNGVSIGTQFVREAWGDAREITIMSAKFQLENDVTTSAINCPVQCNGYFSYPDKGKIVPPGTKELVITPTFTPPATANGMHVMMIYHTASEKPPTQVELVSGAPLAIATSEKDVDAPLTKGSIWWFAFFVVTDSVGAIPAFDVSVTAVAKRAAALPEFPPPPDPWAGRSTVLVIPSSEQTYQLMRTPVTNSCLDCGPGFWEAPPGGLVAAGATKFLIKVSWNWPGPTKPFVGAWNSVDPNGKAAKMTKDGDSSREFEYDVPADQVDSPYQLRSGWGVWFGLDTNGQGGGVAFGSLKVEASAVRAPS